MECLTLILSFQLASKSNLEIKDKSISVNLKVE